MKDKKELPTVEARFWLRKGKDRFLASGKIELMKAIKDTGSISAASRKMGISYRKAWNLVDRLNAFSGKEAIKTEKGGKGGGGASLSRHGEKLLKIYAEAQKRFSCMLEELNKELRENLENDD